MQCSSIIHQARTTHGIAYTCYQTFGALQLATSVKRSCWLIRSKVVGRGLCLSSQTGGLTILLQERKMVPNAKMGRWNSLLCLCLAGENDDRRDGTVAACFPFSFMCLQLLLCLLRIMESFGMWIQLIINDQRFFSSASDGVLVWEICQRIVCCWFLIWNNQFLCCLVNFSFDKSI